VGSGNLAGARHPRNTALLLDGQSGEVLGCQEKLFRFNMSAAVLERWGLAARLGSLPVDEDVRCGELLCVLEAGAIRAAVLICEDLARVTDLSPLVRDLGLSHVLVPVFSRPLRERRWEQRAAQTYGEATGTTAVISNSLIVQAITGKGGGSAMVLSPASGEALIGSSASATEPTCFLLGADGTAELA
jgi:predicted amidohydrolase